jgi:hypothetical protein
VPSPTSPPSARIRLGREITPSAGAPAYAGRVKSLVIAIALLWCTRPALADVAVSGTYDVKFEEVGNGCDPPPITLGRSKLVVSEP